MPDLTPVLGRGLLGAVKASTPWFLALGLAAVSFVTSPTTWALAPPAARAQARAVHAEALAAKAAKSGSRLAEERYADTALRFRKAASILERAAQAEATAAELERKTVELETQARRARTLVEQTETRRARAQARLQELGLMPESTSGPQAVTTDGAAAAQHTADEQTSSSEQP